MHWGASRSKDLRFVNASNKQFCSAFEASLCFSSYSPMFKYTGISEECSKHSCLNNNHYISTQLPEQWSGPIVYHYNTLCKQGCFRSTSQRTDCKYNTCSARVIAQVELAVARSSNLLVRIPAQAYQDNYISEVSEMVANLQGKDKALSSS